MPKKPTVEETSGREVFVLFDMITADRLKHQAARKHGTNQGFIQAYVRASVLKSLEADEQSEEKVKASMREFTEDKEERPKGAYGN